MRIFFRTEIIKYHWGMRSKRFGIRLHGSSRGCATVGPVGPIWSLGLYLYTAVSATLYLYPDRTADLFLYPCQRKVLYKLNSFSLYQKNVNANCHVSLYSLLH